MKILAQQKLAFGGKPLRDQIKAIILARASRAPVWPDARAVVGSIEEGCFGS